MNPQALEQIQTKIAFLERANADLSDVVYRQQQEIRGLDARIKELLSRLDAAQSEQPQSEQSPTDHERPPHY